MTFRPSLKILFVFAVFILIMLVETVLKSDSFSSIRTSNYNQTNNGINKRVYLKIDNKTKYSEEQVLEQVEKELPNLPASFWYKNVQKTFRINASCAIFPNILDIRYSNTYWQILESVNRTFFHLYAAYFDKRERNINGPVVRILGMINSRNPSPNTHCQLWFENNNQPVIVKVKEYKHIWYKEWSLPGIDRYEPYLIVCVIPKTFQNTTPSSVSIVNNPCDTATNNLKVIHNPAQKRKEFGVCVKGLDFSEDLSVRIVEWLELIKLLGADKVFLYELNIHKNTSRVLQYYQQLGRVEVIPITTAGYTPNEPLLRRYFLKNRIFAKRHNELIPYNDCFYRHMYEYKYIVLLDIDEVIMPVSTENWASLLQKIIPESMQKIKKKPSHYHSQNTFYLDSFLDKSRLFSDIPWYMHMLQHVYRTESFTGPGLYVKSFFDTEAVIALHNHHPIHCFESCNGYSIRTVDSQLNHYRASCDSATKKECDELLKSLVLDNSIWRYKDSLIKEVNYVLVELGFL